MSDDAYRITTGIMLRWIIQHPQDDHLAWSGMRWVPMNGTVQICNFASEEDARQYAKEVIEFTK